MRAGLAGLGLLLAGGCAPAEIPTVEPSGSLRPAEVDGGWPLPPWGEPDGDCPAGADGSTEHCTPPGIMGCVAPFVDEEGVCRPAPGDCPPGTIAVFDQGCEPVGIPDCAPEFMDEDGLCRPALGRCPPGTIPEFSTGCVTVGLPACAPEFQDEDGFCRPALDRCLAGQIPVGASGCAPVGVTPCAPEFLTAEGSCAPRAARCPADHIPAPATGCLPLDGPAGCPEGRWPALAAGPTTVYVDPAAGPGGTGTRAQPYRMIRTALMQRPPPARIALAAGEYRESVAITHDVELIGSCPARVRWGGSPMAEPTATIWIERQAQVSLQSLTVAGPGPGVVVFNGAQLRLQSVEIRDTLRHGLYAEGAGTVVLATDCLIGATRGDPSGMAWAVTAILGARLELVGCALLDNEVSGISVSDSGSLLFMTDGLIEGTLRQSATGADGIGLTVRQGASAYLAQAALVGNQGAGVLVDGPGSALILEQSQIEATAPHDEIGGLGLVLGAGTRAQLRQVALHDNRQVGVVAQGAEARVELVQSLIRGTRASGPAAEDGIGLQVIGGAQGTITGSVIDDNQTGGIVVGGVGAELTATDSLVSRTREGPAGTPGYGLGVTDRAHAVLTRLTVRDNEGFGLMIHEPGTRAELSDSLVADNVLPARVRSQQFATAGLQVLDGAGLRSRRNALLANGFTGVRVAGADAQLNSAGDLVAFTREGLQPEEGDKKTVVGRGIGLGVAQQARAEVQGSVFFANQTLGIAVGDGRSELRLTRSLLEETRPRTSDGGWGHNLQLDGGARAVLTGCAVTEGWDAAIWAVEPETTLELSRSYVGSREPVPTPDGQLGLMLVGAQAVLDHNAFVGNDLFGIVVGGPTARLTSHRDLIRQTQARSPVEEYPLPRGLALEDGGQATLEGTTLLDNTFVGLLVLGPGSHATARGLLVAGTRAGVVGDGGFGVLLTEGGQAELTDAALLDNQELGLLLTMLHPVPPPLARATQGWLHRVLVAGTVPGLDGTWGGGVLVDGGARLELTRSRVEDQRVFGVLVHAAEGYLADTLIRGTRPGTLTEPDGRRHPELADGLLALNGAHCTLARLLLRDQTRAGLLFDKSEGQLDHCQALANGYGLVLQRKAVLEGLATCSLRDNQWADLWTDEPLTVPDQIQIIPSGADDLPR